MFASLQELEKMLDTKVVMLSNEPPLGDEKAVTIVVRMPNGGRCERRFLKTDKLQVKMVLESKGCKVVKLTISLPQGFLLLLPSTC